MATHRCSLGFLSALVVVGMLLSSGVARSQQPSVDFGYIPCPTAGTVQIRLFGWAGSCGSDAVCDFFPYYPTIVSAAGDDALAVMAAIDRSIGSVSCWGAQFQTPVSISGSTPTEVRHRYRMGTSGSGGTPALLWVALRVDRGAISLTSHDVCGEAVGFVGPYSLTIYGPPQTSGTFVLRCAGKPTIAVPVEPTTTPEEIASAVLAAAIANGIHAAASGGASVLFNVARYEEDVSGLEFAGMLDGSPIPLELENAVMSWVPTRSTTWGEIRAKYR